MIRMLLLVLAGMITVTLPELALGQSTPAVPVQEASVSSEIVAPVAKPELQRPTNWGEPTEVRILIYVIDVDEVDSANQSFAASVYVEARCV